MSSEPVGYLQFFHNGPAEPVALDAESQPVIVGRSPQATITVEDSKASRQHCELRVEADGPSVVVVDLGSRSGTLVNGSKIDGTQTLKQGDRLRVGHTEFAFVLDKETAEALAKDVAAGDSSSIAADDESGFAPVGLEAQSHGEVPEDTPYLVPYGSNSGGDVELPARSYLVNPRTVLGRKSSNDIVIRATSISGTHCEFLRDAEAGTIRVRDLDSTNGICVNGHTVTDALLHTDDVISVEKIALRFVDPVRPATDPPVPKLVVLVGELSAPLVAVGETEITIGRNKHTNSHPLKSDTEASAMHARIYRHEGRVCVEDVGSTNGTRVDGRKVEPNTPTPLGHGSKVKIGHTILRFEDPTAPPADPEPEPEGDEADTLPEGELEVGEVLAGVAEPDLKLDEQETKKKNQRQSPPKEYATSAEQEMEQFLHSGKGRRKSRAWIWRGAEVGLLVVVLGGVVLALMTGARGVAPEETLEAEDVVAPANSLIRTNWSFEQVRADEDDTRRVPGWDFVPGMRYDTHFSDQGHAQTGGRSLMIARQTSEDYRSTDAFSVDVIDVEAGQVLSASAFVRRGRGTAGGGGLKILFFADPEATSPLATTVSPLVRPAEWQEVVLDATVPEGARAARVGVSVAGGAQRMYFDDVVARLDESAAQSEQPLLVGTGALAEAQDGVVPSGLHPVVLEQGRLRMGRLEWRMHVNGTFELLRHADEEEESLRPHVMLRQLDPLLRKRGDDSLSRMFDLSIERRVTFHEAAPPGDETDDNEEASNDASPLDDFAGEYLVITSRLIDPHSRATGTIQLLAEVEAELVLGFSSDGDPRLILSAPGLRDFGELGFVGDLPRFSTQQPIARFLEDGDRGILSYYHAPLHTREGRPVAATRLVVPYSEEYIHLGHLDQQGRHRFHVLGSRRGTRLELLLTSSQEVFVLPIAVDPHAQAVRRLREQASLARGADDDAAALAAILEALALTLHDPRQVRIAEADFARIVSPLEFQIRETQLLLQQLDRAFTRERLVRAQDQAEAIRNRLAPELVAELPQAVLTRYRPGRQRSQATNEVIDEGDYEAEYPDIFASMANSLRRLAGWAESFDDLQQARHTEVDASMLAWWEDRVAPLLTRAIDFQRGGDRAMATTLYRRVVQEMPLSRPSTLARLALTEIAEELLAEAEASEYSERATDLRELARTLAREVLATEWPQAQQLGVDGVHHAWDPESNSFGEGRANEVIDHFYQVAETTQTDEPAAGLYHWREFTKRDWQDLEAQARAAARTILGED